MAKRKRKQLPVMLLWDRKSQVRFIEAVEKLVGLVGDMEMILAAPKRRREAAVKANRTRSLAADQVGAGENGKELRS